MSSRLRCLALSAAALLAVAGFSQQASAEDDSSGYELPKAYVGGLGYWVKPDSDRNQNNEWGSRAFVGTRLDSGLMVEINGFGQQGKRDVGSGKDAAWGVGGDFLMPFLDNKDFRPFFLAGGGFTDEKVQGSFKGAGYANAGLGMLIELTQGLYLRPEARYVATFSDHASTSNNQPLYDVDVGIGLQADIGKPKPIDSDGDGVPDYLDKCPNTPRGATVDSKGCPVDSDGDGVPDYLDKCPNTPRGATVDATGCPIDSDRDGVPDYLDKCPNTPYGLKVDATGCVRDAQTIVLQNVNFEFNKATLTADSHTVLDGVAQGLKSDPQMRVELSGHTDSIGKAAYNKTLSQKRADSVKAYLITAGVPATQMVAKGYGKDKPIASNDTDTGRAQNRRVEFRVLSK